MQNTLGSQTNPQMVENGSANDKLISGNAVQYHDSIISVHEYAGGKKIRSKCIDLKKSFIACELDSADYLEGVKEYFPLQLLGCFLQRVLSEDLKAFLFLR